jgi:hypothetical protein
MPTRWPPGATYQIMSQWACKATQCAESYSQLNLPLAKRKPSERGGRVELPPCCRYCVSVALDSISNKRKTRASNLTDLVCTWKVLLLRERLVCLSAYLVTSSRLWPPPDHDQSRKGQWIAFTFTPPSYCCGFLTLRLGRC